MACGVGEAGRIESEYESQANLVQERKDERDSADAQAKVKKLPLTAIAEGANADRPRDSNGNTVFVACSP